MFGKAKNILPNWWFTSDLPGTIPKQITLKDKSKDSWKIIEQRKTYKALIIDPPPTAPESFPPQSSSQSRSREPLPSDMNAANVDLPLHKRPCTSDSILFESVPNKRVSYLRSNLKKWWPSDHAKLQTCRVWGNSSKMWYGSLGFINLFSFTAFPTPKMGATFRVAKWHPVHCHSCHPKRPYSEHNLSISSKEQVVSPFFPQDGPVTIQ